MARKVSKELARYESARPVALFHDMEREFGDFFRRSFPLLGRTSWPFAGIAASVTPIVDIFEDNGNVVMKAELPGMTRDDIDVNISGNMLTISGEKKKEEKIEQKDYYSMERSYGSFTRSFHLPTSVQMEKIEAHFKDGVLEIVIPKTDEALKKEKKIKIQ
jgi:HSP20 family protein